jgi:hypothetical protein
MKSWYVLVRDICCMLVVHSFVQEQAQSRIGVPRAAMRSRYVTNAFSSKGVRYCCSSAFVFRDGYPLRRYHAVVRGTLRSIEAYYVSKLYYWRRVRLLLGARIMFAPLGQENTALRGDACPQGQRVYTSNTALRRDACPQGQRVCASNTALAARSSTAASCCLP